MVFGYWAIITGIVCVLGFSYLVYASFSDEPVEKPIESADGLEAQE